MAVHPINKQLFPGNEFFKKTTSDLVAVNSPQQTTPLKQFREKVGPLPDPCETMEEINWRIQTLKSIKPGTKVTYFGPSNAWYGTVFTKEYDTKRKMQVKHNGKVRRFQYEHLTCTDVETTLDTAALLAGTPRQLFPLKKPG